MKRKTVSACVNDTEHTSERHDVQREIISPRRRIIFLELTVIYKRKSVWSHEKHMKLDRRTEISGISRFASEDRTFLPNTSSLVANTFLHSATWCGIRSNTFDSGVHVASRSWRGSSTDFRNAFASRITNSSSYFYVSTSIFLAYCRILSAESALHEGHGGYTVGELSHYPLTRGGKLWSKLRIIVRDVSSIIARANKIITRVRITRGSRITKRSDWGSK